MTASRLGGSNKGQDAINQDIKWHRAAHIGIEKLAGDRRLLAQDSSEIGNAQGLRTAKLAGLSVGRADKEYFRESHALQIPSAC